MAHAGPTPDPRCIVPPYRTKRTETPVYHSWIPTRLVDDCGLASEVPSSRASVASDMDGMSFSALDLSWDRCLQALKAPSPTSSPTPSSPHSGGTMSSRLEWSQTQNTAPLSSSFHADTPFQPFNFGLHKPLPLKSCMPQDQGGSARNNSWPRKAPSSVWNMDMMHRESHPSVVPRPFTPKPKLQSHRTKLVPATPTTPWAPQSDARTTIVVSNLAAHISEDDLRAHFENPPEWPDSHPIRQVCANVGQTAPLRPAPLAVLGVEMNSERSQALVYFQNTQDCERALVELQHTILTPRQKPWKPVRVQIAIAHTQPDRPAQRQATRVQEDKSRRAHAPKRRLADASRSAGRTREPLPEQEPERVPTTLTFMPPDESQEEVENAQQLSNALTAAHMTSALDPANTTVFVGSLFSMASEGTLYSLFAPFGQILSVNIPHGQDCGFVQFVRKEDAARAIAKLQRSPVAGGSLRLSWGRNIGEKAAARAATRAGLRWVEDAS
ncbi:hypothetical protein MVES1_000261 [Malassezia vespertilionis]|uniref:Ngr1p n=1 Tax=Malassezia vespertilionis TaxID=2020962 RepID=A0A2N1JGP0_9BASI|nr:uncharacterized protein MVES1_000261 [Malassezia vespertilionis]PKI85699.1 Ngr1p [Malassezia vespertilionis]WFD04936.1 hypothetical protein MVES1_000261 [Malassezia vespertilionis]